MLRGSNNESGPLSDVCYDNIFTLAVWQTLSEDWDWMDPIFASDYCSV